MFGNFHYVNSGISLECAVSSSDASKSNVASATFKKDIYVCTFCQVFSTQLVAVSKHIVSSHSESLPNGTNPENFISKLKALEGIQRKPKGQKSFCKKKQEERFEPYIKKQQVLEPTPGPGGLFWCKNCLRSFKKPRQLKQHICIEYEQQDSLSEESPVESDDEFKMYVDVDPIPWSRKKLGSHMKHNSSSLAQSDVFNNSNSVNDINGTVYSKPPKNWRSDPSYIHLFQDKEEKASFEAHVKAIDYSCVDTLFRMEEKRCRTNNKKSCSYIQSKVYSCVCCKKVSKSLSHMRLHCLTHTDFKPFSCLKCSYCTNSKGSLYIHMRKHTGNMFSCSFCDFKAAKRAHLLDHEATHSSVPQICKLCKNCYKTQRSLIAHVRKYHINPVGKRYIKSLTSKGNKNLQCNICKKKFKSTDTLQNHNQVCHEQGVICNEPKLNPEEQLANEKKKLHKLLAAESPDTLEQTANNIQGKDPLAEIVLSNFLQQEQSDSIYNSVFNESAENVLRSSNVLLNFPAKNISQLPSEPTSVLEECRETLDLSILNQCLQNTDFTNECVQEFNIPSNLSNEEHSTVINSSDGHVLGVMSEDKIKPAEIKLFEKCRRAPAYVCCVCSAIYICSTTLKAHLKDHLNNTTSSAIIDQPDEQFEPSKISDTSNALDNVCEILQNSSETCSFDEELEKLYTSSLDMIWYLPEVSVVLQNDPALIDSVLDDISNFPMSDKYDPPEDMDGKDSVLKCFDEL